MSSSRGYRTALQVGVPLVTFMFGGVYFLSTTLQTKLDVKDQKQSSVSQRAFDLEEEHKKLMASLNIDEFKLSRIPRPDEADKSKTKQPPETKIKG